MALKRSVIGAVWIMVVSASGLVSAPTVAAVPRQMALGIWMEGGKDTYNQFSKSVGRTPAIWAIARDWGPGGKGRFPNTSLLRYLQNHGSVPMITWDPVGPNVSTVTQKRILAGKFDGRIRDFAKRAKAWGGTVIVRFAHEFDGYWYPWGVQYPGNTVSRFIRVWRYVWRIVKGNRPATPDRPADVNATNVRFLWSPTSPCKPNVCPDWATMYPGDRYVDYVGMTGVNWGFPNTPYERRARPWAKWKNMVKVLTPGITELTRVAPAKPIIVAELASSSDIAGAVAGTTKAGWISKGYSATFNHPGWEQIVGIVYFNVNMRHHDPPHEDWRLTSPDVSPRNAYKGLLTQMRFQGTIH